MQVSQVVVRAQENVSGSYAPYCHTKSAGPVHSQIHACSIRKIEPVGQG